MQNANSFKVQPGDTVYDISYNINETGVSKFIVKAIHITKDKVSYIIENVDNNTGPVDSVHDEDFGSTIFTCLNDAIHTRKIREKEMV